jgi:hypothetical protein
MTMKDENWKAALASFLNELADLVRVGKELIKKEAEKKRFGQ